MNAFKKTIAAAALFSTALLAHGKNTCITDYGAVPDGVTLNTEAIQKAIDACAESGGGRVTVPAGVYLTGSVALRSHVELYLERNAKILGSLRIPEDFPFRALISGRGITDAGISGPGVIDGHSNDPSYRQRFRLNDGKRPRGVQFTRCTDISVRDVHIINAGSWTLDLAECDGVTIDGVRIYSLEQGNNDGIDVDARNVTISNCRISSDDDGICMKNDRPNFVTEHITITNCVVASNCNAIKFGTPSYKGFRNITVSNCVIRGTEESNIWNWGRGNENAEPYPGVPDGVCTALAGIALEAVDGAECENLSFSNITMEGVITPIFVCTGHRKNSGGYIRNIQFSNITAKAYGVLPCLFSGLPDARIEGVVLRDIFVEHEGGRPEMTEPLGQNVKGYPENRMYGMDIPGCGLYMRCTDNVHIDNFQVTQRTPDARPAISLDDVDGFRLRALQVKGSTAKKQVAQRGCKGIVIEK